MPPFSVRASAYIALVALAVRPINALAMSSTNYQIQWDSFLSGGLQSGGSASYQAQDSLGGGFAGEEMQSGAYIAEAGYRAGDERPLSFEVVVAPVGGTSAQYASVSISGKTVTFAGGAVAGAFAVGDRIALVENAGLSQLVVVGKVASIAGAVITVDRFDGDTSTLSAAPSAGTAYAKLLSGSAMNFGSISASSASVATGLVSVTSDVRSGYTVYAVADGRPQTGGGLDIDPVSDGAVTVGSEEYGIEVIGDRAATSGDVGIATTQVAVQSSTNVTGIPADRVAFSYKLAISSSATQAGTYAQTVSFTLTPNY